MQFAVNCPGFYGTISATCCDGASVRGGSDSQDLSARGQRLVRLQISCVPAFDLAGFVPIAIT